MRKHLIARLRSRAGESIAEVLVALLISVLGIALLVGMIGASTRVISQSTKTMQDEYLKTDTSAASSVTFIELLYENGNPVLDKDENPITFQIVDQIYDGTPIYYVPKTSTGF